MRFDLSDIPRPPQTTGTCALGNRPFNARSFGIAFFKLCRVFALASPLQDVILRARFKTQGAWPSRCAGALGPSSPSLATRCGKADVDPWMARAARGPRSEEHTSELQSLTNLVCRLLLEKKKTQSPTTTTH